MHDIVATIINELLKLGTVTMEVQGTKYNVIGADHELIHVSPDNPDKYTWFSMYKLASGPTSLVKLKYDKQTGLPGMRIDSLVANIPYTYKFTIGPES